MKSTCIHCGARTGIKQKGRAPICKKCKGDDPRVQKTTDPRQQRPIPNREQRPK
ncbi:MAG: hypothetical protein L0229_22525 [Blastocatellia bacterium]|nr:hypothetical protein [Blastocatellia bacterium]